MTTNVESAMTVTHGDKLPLKSWAADLDETAAAQAYNLTTLPFAFHHISLMPDSHGGYGMPIGGVLATKGYVVPNSIGVDAGCGMNARRTNIRAEIMQDTYPGQGTVLQAILGAIQRNVPTGNGPHGNQSTPLDMPDEFIQQWASIDNTLLRGVPSFFDETLNKQLGTLGGGNHFLELDVDEEGFVWIMLHSGSRAFGKKICDHFNSLAKTLNERYFSSVSSKTELNFLDLHSTEGRSYMAWMQLAMAYAKFNREHMLDACTEAVFGVCKRVAPDSNYLTTEAIDTHHNYADYEHHFGQDVLVTRKGATRAREGEMLIIPGSMETGSYIARGKGNLDSFTSAPHGAGRAMSRGKARNARTVDDMVASLKAKGIELATASVSGVLDEAGHAYHDIEDVMHRSADLVEPVYKLRPLGVVKGSDDRHSKRR